MDPNNPVVKLCVEGMRAEAEGREEDARDLFLQAWSVHQDDYEACIAAHYLARQQENLEDTLYWNQVALDRADTVGDDRVQGFYPSLLLNLGRCHEVLGNQEAARRYYELAAGYTAHLPADRYGNLVQDGIAQALARTRPPVE